MSRFPWFDAGHGGRDPGAVGVVKEKDVTLAISLKCQAAARRQGWSVGMTRTTDVFVALADRYRGANAANAQAFVSIHADWIGAKGAGFQVIKPNPSSGGDNRLADRLFANLDPLTGYKDVGVYADRRGLAVLRGTNMPACIVEVLSVAEAVLAEDAFQSAVAERIVMGLCQWFGVDYVAPDGSAPATPAPKPKPKPTTQQKGDDPVSRLRTLDLRPITSSSATFIRSNAVRTLQGLLVARGHAPANTIRPNGSLDGVAGPGTKAALGNFQRATKTGSSNGEADFIVGPKTWAALLDV